MGEIKGCPFCSSEVFEKRVGSNDTMFAIWDNYPVTKGHMLIIPKRHTPDYFSMTDEERLDVDKLLQQLKRSIELNDETVTGFNIGMNCGASAGQTVFHAHIHLIPRRDGDTASPRGGVRGVIPDKMSY